MTFVYQPIQEVCPPAGCGYACGVNTLRYTALIATAGLAISGCGDEATPSTGETPSALPSASTSPTSPVPSTPTPTAAGPLPLTITRDGGIVGFSDRIVVGTDGIATISGRGTAPARCRVDPVFLAGLTAAAGAVDWSALGQKRPTVRHPDDLIIAVAAQGGIARLDDPLVRPLVDPVGRLLADAGTPPASRKLCKPV